MIVSNVLISYSRYVDLVLILSSVSIPCNG